MHKVKGEQVCSGRIFIPGWRLHTMSSRCASEAQASRVTVTHIMHVCRALTQFDRGEPPNGHLTHRVQAGMVHNITTQRHCKNRPTQRVVAAPCPCVAACRAPPALPRRDCQPAPAPKQRMLNLCSRPSYSAAGYRAGRHILGVPLCKSHAHRSGMHSSVAAERCTIPSRGDSSWVSS